LRHDRAKEIEKKTVKKKGASLAHLIERGLHIYERKKKERVGDRYIIQ
jgi:hypothetical protein